MLGTRATEDAALLERPGLIASLPRVLQRLPDQQKALALASRLFTPWLDDTGSRRRG